MGFFFWMADQKQQLQIPAARFPYVWENFFGLKRFARIAEIRRFGSLRGVRSVFW
jgi:hypothetical protein